MSIAPKSREHRRAQREPVCFRCDVTPVDGPAFSGLIVNISPFGCMMRTEQPVAEGTSMRFALPVIGTTSAFVVWAMGGRIGLEFEQSIDAAPYLALLRQLSQPGDEMGFF